MLITATWPEFSGTECAPQVWGVLNRDVQGKGARGEWGGQGFWEAVGRLGNAALQATTKRKLLPTYERL